MPEMSPCSVNALCSHLSNKNSEFVNARAKIEIQVYLLFGLVYKSRTVLVPKSLLKGVDFLIVVRDI